MPAGRSSYALVAEYFTFDSFKQMASAAYEVLCEIGDAQELGRLQPPLTDDMAEAVMAFRDAGPEATSQFYSGAHFLLQAVFQHAHRRDGV